MGRAVCSLLVLLCSISSHAFTLADLTVSSSQFTVFHAVLPFSQTLPGASREIQVQTGSPSDYERWGLTRAEALKFIRARVVLTREDAGYIELVSADPVAEQTFDLLLWVSHGQQKMPLHYKVTVAEKSTVSKGEVMLVPLTAPLPASNKPLPNNFVQANLPSISRNVETNSVPASAPIGKFSTVTASANAADGAPKAQDTLTLSPLVAEPNPTEETMPDDLKSQTEGPFVTVLMPHLSLSKTELMVWLALVCSALLLLGFLLGRQHWGRRLDAPNTEPESQSPELNVPVRSARPAHEVSSHAFTQEAKVADNVRPIPTRPTLVVDSARKTRASPPRTVAEDRLNLAKIYLSMGDATTAKSVLDEVIAEGSEPETTQALKLIQEMV
ncbi:FimV/HubP family polar landmark protein [Limnohabitans sp. DM1]|uniref:FimV/HubP family polar landmark protein n=1 Tax=Limnohabitans sp. DM1 TaxID=1597955 RepID=UPI001892AFC5|nr:FimV/HubP family polar landmark protein [Limnohabitans sp. DM1]